MTENSFKRAIEIKEELDILYKRLELTNRALNAGARTHMSFRYRNVNGSYNDFKFENISDKRTKDLLEIEAKIIKNGITKLEHEFKIL